MSWKKIIKDEKTQIVAMLEEGILPGYSIRLNDEGFRNSIMVNVSKFPELKNKEFYDLQDMNNLNIVKSRTEAGYNRNSFIYKFMSSMRQKVNDPLGQRAKKRENARKR